MPFAAAAHAEDFAVPELKTFLGSPVQFQILFQRVATLGIRGHVGVPLHGVIKVRRVLTIFNLEGGRVGARPCDAWRVRGGLEGVYNAPNLRVKESALAAVRPPQSQMPRRTDIRKILIIGSGPIVIGQA